MLSIICGGGFIMCSTTASVVVSCNQPENSGGSRRLIYRCDVVVCLYFIQTAKKMAVLLTSCVVHHFSFCPSSEISRRNLFTQVMISLILLKSLRLLYFFPLFLFPLTSSSHLSSLLPFSTFPVCSLCTLDKVDDALLLQMYIFVLYCFHF